MPGRITEGPVECGFAEGIVFAGFSRETEIAPRAEPFRDVVSAAVDNADQSLVE
jgi:hypothetical protein